MSKAIRKDREKAILTVAEDQAGYFTAKQALIAGYSYRLQHYHKTAANWGEISRGLFRLTFYPNFPNEDLIRWSLWSRNREDLPQAVISHETALSVHELGDLMPEKIHLTVPPLFRKKTPPGCILHRSVIPPEQVEQRGGYSVTKPLKTIVDVAEAAISTDRLEQAVRDALHKGMLRIQEIVRYPMSSQAKDRLRIVVENIRKHPTF